jgi:hypothetical protein
VCFFGKRGEGSESGVGKDEGKGHDGWNGSNHVRAEFPIEEEWQQVATAGSRTGLRSSGGCGEPVIDGGTKKKEEGAALWGIEEEEKMGGEEEKGG